MTGLPISNVVSVSINLSQVLAALRNFGALCITGPTDVIDVNTRFRTYSSLASLGADFGTTAPEYLAGKDFFSQSPQPSILYVARWAQTASRARLTSGVIPVTAQAALIASLSAVTGGAFAVALNGGAVTQITGANFTGAITMNQLAAAVATALGGSGSCVWDSVNNQFILRTTMTGTTANFPYPVSPTAGVGITDITTTFKLTQATGALSVPGIAAETPLACVNNLLNLSNDWYGLMFALTNIGDMSTNDHLAVAAAIQAATPARIYGCTSMDSTALSAAIAGTSTDLPYLLSTSTLERAFCQYSSNDPYAVASLYGRGFTVDFSGNNTTITLNGKVEPGVTPETLSLSQANNLKARNCNVFVNYSQAAALIQYGTMANGYYFDEVQGTDWLANEVQTDLFNAIINAATKIPQTDAGNNYLKTVANGSMEKGINNGLLAPGYWYGEPVGTINTGDFLPNGYYVYIAPIATQAPSDRQARKAVPIQVACCLAGAIHSANVLINVQR